MHMRKPSPPGAIASSFLCAVASAGATFTSIGYAMANSETGMAVTLGLGGAAALAGSALSFYATLPPQRITRPLLLTTSTLGLLANVAAGALTIFFAVIYRWNW
jgi:hypothetical protein